MSCIYGSYGYLRFLFIPPGMNIQFLWRIHFFYYSALLRPPGGVLRNLCYMHHIAFLKSNKLNSKMNLHPKGFGEQLWTWGM